MKKFIVFVLSLAMVVTAVPMVAFAAGEPSLPDHEVGYYSFYDNYSAYNEPSTLLGSCYLNVADASQNNFDITKLSSAAVGTSYFYGGYYQDNDSSANEHKLVATDLYVGNTIRMIDCLPITIHGLSLENSKLEISQKSGNKIVGNFASVKSITNQNKDYTVTLCGDTTINSTGDGECFIDQTNGYALTVTGSSIVHVATGSASTITLGGSATLYINNNNPNLKVVGKSENVTLIVNDAESGPAHSYVGVQGQFGYVNTKNATVAENADAEYLILTGETTVGAIGTSKSVISIITTNACTLNLKDGATAYLFAQDCGSKINVYDATLYVCKDQLTGEGDSPNFEDVTLNDTVVIGHGTYYEGGSAEPEEIGNYIPEDGTATSSAVLYVEDGTSTDISVCIKGIFKEVETEYNEDPMKRDFVTAVDDTIICSSTYSAIEAYGHKDKNVGGYYCDNNNLLWLFGEKSFYDVIGNRIAYGGCHHDMSLVVGEHNVLNTPIVNAAGYFSDVKLENGYLNFGYLSGKLDQVIGYAYEVEEINHEEDTGFSNFFDAFEYMLTGHQAEMIELQKEHWENYISNPFTGVHESGDWETNDYILTSAGIYTEDWCVVGAADAFWGYDYVDQKDGGYLLWNSEYAFEYGSYFDFSRVDGARVLGTFQKITTSRPGDTDQVVMCGSTHIKEGENYIYTGDYCLNYGGDEGIFVGPPGEYESNGWNLTLGSNASGAAIGHIVSYHTGLFSGYGANPLHWSKDCDTLGTVRVYENATADVLGVVDNYPEVTPDDQGRVAAGSVGFLHQMNPHRHSLSIEEIVGYGGSVNISLATHADIYYDGGDTYRYVEDVANVMIPTIRGNFANAEGQFIQDSSYWKTTTDMNLSGTVYVDQDNLVLKGSCEKVLVGTQFVDDEPTAPVNLKLVGHADTLVVSSGVITVEGSANEIIINGGTVILSGTDDEHQATANKVTVNGGKFIMGNNSKVEAVIGETDTESVAVKVQPAGSFYMYNGLIKLSQPTNNHKDLVMVGVENNGTAILSNGEIVINGGTVNNSAVLNSSRLVVGYYGEYDGADLKDATSWIDRLSGKWISTAGDSSLNIFMNTGIGIDNAAVTSETYVYDTSILIEHGIGIDAVNNYDSEVNAGKLYILSGDKTVKDATVNCQFGFLANNGIVDKYPVAQTVSVTVNGADAIGVNIGPNTSWIIEGPYQSSVFNAATALRVDTTYNPGIGALKTLEDVPTGGLEPADYNPYSWAPYHGKGYDVLEPLAEDIVVLDRPLSCGLFIGNIEFYDHESQTSELIDINQFIPQKNFRVIEDSSEVSLVTTRKISLVTDEEWQLRYALENREYSQGYTMPMDIQLDLYEGAHGMCNLGDIDISFGEKTLNLNGHTLTGEAGKDVLHLVRNTGAKLYIKGTGTISASGIHADAVYVESGKLYVQSNAVLDANGTEANSVYVNGGYAEIVDGRYKDNVYIQSGELVVKGGTFNGDVVKAGGNVHLHAGKYNGAIENRSFGGDVAHVTNNDAGMIQTNHELFAGAASVQTNVKKIEAVSGGMVLSKMNIKTLLDSPGVKLLYNIDLNEPDCEECGLVSKYGDSGSYTWTITTEKSLDLNGFVLTNSNTIGDTIVVNEGGNLILKAGAKNGGKILSYNDSKNDSLFVNKGKLTVESGCNGYVYQLHVLDIDDSDPYKSNAVLNGGEYGMVYTSDSSNWDPTAPIYKVLPNNLDWYNLATGDTYVRNVAFSSVTELPHVWGVNYTVTSAAHELALDKDSATVSDGDRIELTVTVTPSPIKLTWTVTGTARFKADGSTDYDSLGNDGVDVASSKKLYLKAGSGTSTVTVSDEYGVSKTFTINPSSTPTPTPPAPSYAGGGGGGSSTPAKQEPTKVETVWKDVDTKRYYYDAMQWCYDNNILAPNTSSKFGIGDNISRAEFFNALYKAAGSPKVSASATTPFKDVAKTADYYNAVVWAYTTGLTNGAGAADVFAPNMELDRAQIVTILWRYSGSKVQEGKIDFTDVEKGRYYEKAVDWATANGIINGTGDGTTFSPKELMLKESAITMLYRKFVKALF